MNNILSEKEYQRFIIDKLVAENGYIERKNVKFDRNFAIDREMLFKFLDDTQPEAMAQIRKVYKDVTEDTVVNFINTEITKAKSSLLSVLKHGVEIAGYKLDLMYTKPATTFNKDLLLKYNKNIFSVMEEVWASDTERIDLVIFLNGFAIMSFELKCNFAGQSYQDAILQYRTQRNPKTRLFYFKAGCIVNFAMDLQEVYMTTRLANDGVFSRIDFMREISTISTPIPASAILTSMLHRLSYCSPFVEDATNEGQKHSEKGVIEPINAKKGEAARPPPSQVR